MGSLSENIPIIDISALIADTPDKYKVAKEINAACTTFGFFYIVGHGIDAELQETLEVQSRTFFAQPAEKKEEIAMKFGGRAWRGYATLGRELTSGRADMKEAIYFGAELEDDHPLVQAKTPFHGRNLFPPNIPGYKETVLEYLSQMIRLGRRLMEGIALSLNLDEKHFSATYTDDPLPLFRIFNYPAKRESVDGNDNGLWAPGSWGVGEHTDYGILTILKQDNLGGLEVKSNSRWIPAPPVAGSFVCNIGDMLDRMTGGYYRSTPHRVHSPKNNVDRISFPFFFDPNYNSEVKPIDNLKDLKTTDDVQERWDKASVHQYSGIYGEYLYNKVSKCFPELLREVN